MFSSESEWKIGRSNIGNGNDVAARAETYQEEDASYLHLLSFDCSKGRKSESNSERKSKHRHPGNSTDNATVYYSDESSEVHNYDNCYDNEIFNMFTQEEQYTELLEPILNHTKNNRMIVMLFLISPSVDQEWNIINILQLDEETHSPKTTPQPKGEQVKDKGKKALSHKEADKEESESDFDAEVRLTSSLEIKNQKKIGQAVKADVAKAKIKKGKEEFFDLQGLDVGIAGWTTIYSQIRKILDNLYKIKEELEVEFSKPLSEQDPIIKLNTLAKKKRKNVDDLYDYFRSTKRYKTSVQFDDHQEGTILNEPSLGGDCWISSEPFSLLVDLNINYPKYSLAEDSSTLVLQAVRRSSSIFTSVYVVVQKLKKALARASVQLGWQCQAERYRSPLRS
ncbi:hypothetical protein Tco_1540449 [Tanacetum coccineum]